MSTERGTYSDRRESALDKNPYHADVDAQVDVGTTMYGIGQVLEPQFCRPPLGPEAAYPVAFADTARDALKPTMTGTLSRTLSRTMP